MGKLPGDVYEGNVMQYMDQLNPLKCPRDPRGVRSGVWRHAVPINLKSCGRTWGRGEVFCRKLVFPLFLFAMK